MCYNHNNVTLSISSLSFCKQKILERNSVGDLTVVEFVSGQNITCLPARVLKRDGTNTLQSGFLSKEVVFSLYYDLRVRKYFMDLFSMSTISLMQCVELPIQPGEVVTRSLATWSCLVMCVRRVQERVVLCAGQGGEVCVQQQEVSDCCGVWGDCSTLVHCHRVNTTNHMVLLIQDFV